MIATIPIQPGEETSPAPLAHGPSAWTITFIRATMLASFDPVASHAVTGAGAPS